MKQTKMYRAEAQPAIPQKSAEEYVWRILADKLEHDLEKRSPWITHDVGRNLELSDANIGRVQAAAYRVLEKLVARAGAPKEVVIE